MKLWPTTTHRWSESLPDLQILANYGKGGHWLKSSKQTRSHGSQQIEIKRNVLASLSTSILSILSKCRMYWTSWANNDECLNGSKQFLWFLALVAHLQIPWILLRTICTRLGPKPFFLAAAWGTTLQEGGRVNFSAEDVEDFLATALLGVTNGSGSSLESESALTSRKAITGSYSNQNC